MVDYQRGKGALLRSVMGYQWREWVTKGDGGLPMVMSYQA